MFGNRNAPAAPAPAPAPAPGRSKYSGITAGDARDPMLGLGTYRVRVIAIDEGRNPGRNRDSVKVRLHVVEAAEGAETPAGSDVTAVHFFTNPGLRELKRFAIHALGCGPTLAQRNAGDTRALVLDGERQYDGYEETVGGQGSIIDATAGRGNGKAPSLAGRLVDVIVSRGKDVPDSQSGASTGDYFRVYTWGVVPDAEQTPAPAAGA